MIKNETPLSGTFNDLRVEHKKAQLHQSLITHFKHYGDIRNQLESMDFCFFNLDELDKDDFDFEFQTWVSVYNNETECLDEYLVSEVKNGFAHLVCPNCGYEMKRQIMSLSPDEVISLCIKVTWGLEGLDLEEQEKNSHRIESELKG